MRRSGPPSAAAGARRILLFGAAAGALPYLEAPPRVCPWRVETVGGPEAAGGECALAVTDEETFPAAGRIFPACPRIILSRAAGWEAVLTAIREGAYCYFSLPCEPAALRHMAALALAHPEAGEGIVLLSAAPEFLSLRLRCRLPTAERLLHLLDELNLDLAPAMRADLAAALRELLINAIEHGGRLDASEWVRVTRIRTRRAVVYHLLDPGAGFSKENLPHAAIANPEGSPLNHLEDRARKGLRGGGFGLLLARQLADELIYNECGNEVVLVKYLEGKAAGGPLVPAGGQP